LLEELLLELKKVGFGFALTEETLEADGESTKTLTSPEGDIGFGGIPFRFYIEFRSLLLIKISKG
jgi:hypothetical protein